MLAWADHEAWNFDLIAHPVEDEGVGVAGLIEQEHYAMRFDARRDTFRLPLESSDASMARHDRWASILSTSWQSSPSRDVS
jgi:hypothetical protein